jgi:hypothetical protein
MRLLPRAIGALLLLTLAAPLHAQRAAVRHGVWIGAGIGSGSARLSCDICRGNRERSTSGYLRIGATLSRTVLVGVEGSAWYDAGSIDKLLSALQGVVLLYPSPTSGFYLKAGLGVMQYSAKDNTDEASSKALSAQVGMGYELAVMRGLSVVPFANLYGSTAADLRFNNTVANLSAKTSLIQVGVGVTLH